MLRTFSTSLPDHPALPTWAAVQGRVQRKLHAELEKGRAWSGDLQTAFYRPFRIGSVHLDHIHYDLIAKRKAATACAAENTGSLQVKIASKKKTISRKEKRLVAATKTTVKLVARLEVLLKSVKAQRKRIAAAKKSSVRAKAEATIAAAQEKIATIEADLAKLRSKKDRLKADLHQHKRRLGVLEHRLARAKEKAEWPSVCFGTRTLFLKQFHLKENGYGSHAEWLRDWRDARSSAVLIEGNAAKEGGNEFVRPTIAQDGSISLEIRLPEAAADRHVRVGRHDLHTVALHGLRFNHGQDAVLAAIRAHEDGAGKPITWRFIRDRGRWYAHVTVHQDTPAAVRDFSRGALGVDVNEHHLAVTLVSADGNPLRTWNIPLCTHGKSTEQARDLIRKAARIVVGLASAHRVPLVSETLDFKEKKARLEGEGGARRARMLSAFAYSAIDKALHSACLRLGVWHERVNPAYTSLIGRVKFARPFGLSVHAAAALVIARRAMGQSERLPVPAEVLLSTGGRVTLLPLEKMGSTGALSRRRHVWSSWNRLAKGLKAVLAAHARSEKAFRARVRLRGRPPAGVAGPAGFSALATAHRRVEVPLDAGPGLDRRACLTAGCSKRAVAASTQVYE